MHMVGGFEEGEYTAEDLSMSTRGYATPGDMEQDHMEYHDQDDDEPQDLSR